jgi:hypothetical protein
MKAIVYLRHDEPGEVLAVGRHSRRAVTPKKNGNSVIFGVIGNTGKVVADSLLGQKKPVRGVVRDAAEGEPWKARGAEVAVATVSDATAVLHGLMA